MSENSTKSIKSIAQKIFIVGSGLAFLGMMILPMLNMFKEPTAPTQAASSNVESKEQLNKIAGGYETVLKREPNNPTALQGLAEIRLKMNDLKGAIAPMEKLVQLYPEEKKLKSLLDAIKQQVKTGKAPAGVGQPNQK
jgi:predicted Zn-dependent protease